MSKQTNQITKKIDIFFDTLKLRHSNYSLIKDSMLSDSQLIKFIEKCIYFHPSAFNVQSTRIVILLNDNVYRLWDHVLGIIPKEMPQILVDELKNCREAYATILFFDDINATKRESEERHMSIENFESWALQSMAMLQSVIWNGLSYIGYGVNIQHFNKELDEYVKKTFSLQNHWKLLAQMNIGLFSKKAANRTRLPINHLLITYK